MSKNVFKVGDRVKVTKATWSNMKVGLTGTVAIINNENNVGVEFDQYINGHNFPAGKRGHGWNLNTEELELVDRKETIHIYRNGNMVTAVKKVNGKTVDTGIARCHPTDIFNFDDGAELAVKRLFGLEPKISDITKIVVKKQDTYKVGDKVLIRKDLAKVNDTKGAGVVDEMHEHAGKVATVTRIITKYTFGLDVDSWDWSTDMIVGKVVESYEVEPRPTKTIVKQARYSVGDTVKIKDNPKSKCATCSSFKLKGKEVVITKVEDDPWSGRDYEVADNFCSVYHEDIEGKVITTSEPTITEIKGSERHAKIGEYIRVETTSGHSLPVGYIGKVTEILDHGTGFVFVDGAKYGDNKCVRPDQYTILVGYKLEVKEVKRPAKIGEYIKLTKKRFSFNKIGDILKVSSVGYDYASVYAKDHPRNTSTSGGYYLWNYLNSDYVVLENYGK